MVFSLWLKPEFSWTSINCFHGFLTCSDRDSLSLSFPKPILTRKNIASTKNSQDVLTSQVSVLRINKATNSSTSIKPSIFQLHWKPLYLVLYLSLLDLTSHSHTASLPLGDKDEENIKEIWQSSYSFHYPRRQTACANVMANLTSLNELSNTRVFVEA